MNPPEEPLGYTKMKYLKNGDLVSWKMWRIIDKKLETLISYGTILNINTDLRGQREVYVADILCSDTGALIKVNLLRLTKEDTN